MSSLSAITLLSSTAFMARCSFAVVCPRSLFESCPILQALAQRAIDADGLLVQRPRPRQIVRKEAGGGKRAQTACQGLGGAGHTHERVGLAQDGFALVRAVGQ